MREIRRILVPTDFSPCARAALEQAVWLASRLGASIELVHVWEPPLYVAPETALYLLSDDRKTIAEYAHDVAEADMSKLVALCKAAGVPVRATVDTGSLAATLLERASRADLVILGTHGRTGLKHALLGSVAERLVRHSPVPVLTVRDGGAQP